MMTIKAIIGIINNMHLDEYILLKYLESNGKSIQL